MKHSFALTMTAALALAAASTAALAAYPERPIKMIVPWAAGGDTDNIFRPFAPLLQKNLGANATVVIANVGGASGTTGAREAKAAAPDGYTIFSVHDYIHLTYYTGIADVNYTDFEPVCLISATPSVLTASAKTPFKDFAGLIADAKARPNQISVGATLGSTSHFFPLLVQRSAGVQFKYVSYDGLAPRMNAILGGHIDLTDSNLTQKGKVEAGQLRFLAIASEKRDAQMPSVPTLKELGHNIVYEVSRGLLLPKGTPNDVIAKVESACAAAAKDPAFDDAMKKQGTKVDYRDRKGHLEFLKSADALNRSVLKEIGLLKRQ